MCCYNLFLVQRRKLGSGPETNTDMDGSIAQACVWSHWAYLIDRDQAIR